MIRVFLLNVSLGVFATFALPASATAMEPIASRDVFLSTLAGRDLSIRLYGLTLTVTPDGLISGRAVGRKVTGEWAWLDGFFCRSMEWGRQEIPYNCQLVEVQGNKMRFTTERGTGDSADFVMR